MPRPRQFDEIQAIERALDAFWTYGYEGASITRLEDAMNMKKGSIYQAFGDKNQLFNAALSRYLENQFDEFSELLNAPLPAYDCLYLLFTDRLVRLAHQSQLQRGCLRVNTVNELAPHDNVIKDMLAAERTRIESMFTEVIARGQQEKSVRDDISANSLAQLAYTTMSGMLTSSKLDANKQQTREVGLSFIVTITI